MQIKDLIPWARKEHDLEAKSGDDNPITSLQRDMNQVFDSFWHRFGQGNASVDWPWAGSDVKSDVVETDKAVEVSVELPGLEMKDIEVTVSNDLLLVKGEKKIERQEDKKGYYLSERRYGSISRAISLPPGVDGERAEAAFKNGVLTVKLPRAPEAQAKIKRVEVKTD
jgi:HSP20 family protein